MANEKIENATMFKLTYGLFVLTAREGEKDAGCIINTAGQVTSSPAKITIAVNKENFTHDVIVKTRAFNVSILSEKAPFDTFKRFGYASGRTVDKFIGFTGKRTENGIYYDAEYANAVISASVIDTVDVGTHTLFVAEVTEAFTLNKEASMTYQYYFDKVKPSNKPMDKKKGYVCKICGYVYEGEPLPDDFICPICKHGAVDFEAIK